MKTFLKIGDVPEVDVPDQYVLAELIAKSNKGWVKITAEKPRGPAQEAAELIGGLLHVPGARAWVNIHEDRRRGLHGYLALTLGGATLTTDFEGLPLIRFGDRLWVDIGCETERRRYDNRMVPTSWPALKQLTLYAKPLLSGQTPPPIEMGDDFRRNEGGVSLQTCLDHLALTAVCQLSGPLLHPMSFANKNSKVVYVFLTTVMKRPHKHVHTWLATDGKRHWFCNRMNEDTFALLPSQLVGRRVPSIFTDVRLSRFDVALIQEAIKGANETVRLG